MSRPKYSTPKQAEDAFYQSFENGDIDAMMMVWDQSDDIVCVHPFGRRQLGTVEVEQGWRGILSGAQRLSFQVESNYNQVSDTLAIHAVLEHIHINGDDTRHMPIIATNAYRLTDNGWRMILHHSSPQPKPDQAESQSESEQAERVLH